MIHVLGVDAAWSLNHPSALALLKIVQDKKPEIIRFGRSYEEYIDEGKVNWENKPKGFFPNFKEILDCSPNIDLIAIDIPIANYFIKGRRYADQAVSKKYGKYKASVHSPNKTRPGEISIKIYQQLIESNYQWATEYVGTRAFIEVYPHVSIIELFGYQERLMYKVDKRRVYWSEDPPELRLVKLIMNLNELRDKLATEISGIDEILPQLDKEIKYPVKNYLKGYEDLLDAFVCAITGYYYLNHKALPVGDRTGVIWVPNTRS